MCDIFLKLPNCAINVSLAGKEAHLLKIFLFTAFNFIARNLRHKRGCSLPTMSEIASKLY